MSKLFLILCFVLTLGLIAQDLPESLHPYENDSKEMASYSIPGAVALEVTFSKLTEVEQDVDFITILDGMGEEVAEYTGTDLAGQTIRIEGDSFTVQLKADDSKNAYGYKVVSVRAIYDERGEEEPDAVDYDSIKDLRDNSLRAALYNIVKGHTSLGYNNARQKMFASLDNVNGYVECVYTGRKTKTSGIPSNNDMNCEHTWPKSLGAKSEPAKSDLHHLYPTDSVTNSRRSSYLFDYVVNPKWTSQGGSVLGTNKYNETTFQPRACHRGNVARSIFYFAVRYQLSIPAHEEATLREWNHTDPVDAAELERTTQISKLQKTRNPFVDHPEFIDQISDF